MRGARGNPGPYRDLSGSGKVAFPDPDSHTMISARSASIEWNYVGKCPSRFRGWTFAVEHVRRGGTEYLREWLVALNELGV